MARGAERGQAAVESIGIAVLVALLLAAVSAWLVREVRPPERPPAVIEAASAPLFGDPVPVAGPSPLPRPVFRMPRGRDDEPIGRALRAAGRGVRSAVVFGIEMRHECALAFGMRLGERARTLLSDPLGGLLEGSGSDLGRPDDVRAYVERLRALPPEEAALAATADVCGAGADLTVEVAQDLLARRLARGPGASRQP